MTERVRYELEESVAILTMDDGKLNVLSPEMLAELTEKLDRAERDEAAVVLQGRAGVFSAGFDLRVLGSANRDAVALLQGGFALAERCLRQPRPLITVCTGHAVAMGLFLLLAADYVVGAAGSYKLHANEVGIGMAIPRAAVELCRARLTPARLHRCLALAEPVAPEHAEAAGIFDRTVPAAELLPSAREVARQLGALNQRAHTETKARVRAPVLAAMRAGMEADHADFRARLAASAAPT